MILGLQVMERGREGCGCRFWVHTQGQGRGRHNNPAEETCALGAHAEGDGGLHDDPVEETEALSRGVGGLGCMS